jgi:hypothetical protein
VVVVVVVDDVGSEVVVVEPPGSVPATSTWSPPPLTADTVPTPATTSSSRPRRPLRSASPGRAGLALHVVPRRGRAVGPGQPAERAARGGGNGIVVGGMGGSSGVIAGLRGGGLQRAGQGGPRGVQVELDGPFAELHRVGDFRDGQVGEVEERECEPLLGWQRHDEVGEVAVVVGGSNP